MDKRFQVFISSTFRDLEEERRQVMQALLEVDCFPAGMELFPAADAGAWGLISRVIDQSDYYVLIVGGKYGTTDKEGISYTEREYDYAAGGGRHVLPFLHERPDDIPAGKTELAPGARQRLTQFRAKVEGKHHCKYWRSAEDLGGKVSRAINVAIKNHPGVGWVRGSQAKTMEDVERLSGLQQAVAELQEENARLKAQLDSLATPPSPPEAPLARLCREITKLTRRVSLEWESLESAAAPAYRNRERANEILETLAETLLGYAVDVDEREHGIVSVGLSDVILQVNRALAVVRTMDTAIEFWDTGRVVLPLMKDLEQRARAVSAAGAAP